MFRGPRPGVFWKTPISPELALLLYCARQIVPSSLVGRLHTAMTQCKNAAYFEGLCVQHKVTSPVYANLERAGPAESGEFFNIALDFLRRRIRKELPRRQRVSRLTTLVAETLANASVTFAFVRGERLAERFYEEPGYRISSDVDILVQRADRDRSVDALLGCGFQLKYKGIELEARAQFKGQIVMRHPQLRMLLDVNWLLTGNSGIGKVEEDLEAVWARARPVDGCEWELSTEDTLFGLVRHVGHGHGFEHGLLQCCMDVAAILRKEGDRIDWDLIGKLARDSECTRVLRFFAHFFDEYYRDETMPALEDKLPRIGAQIGPVERCMFSDLVQVPLLGLAPARHPVARYVKGMICHAGKLWALDRIGRLFKILMAMSWPDKHPLIIMTPYSKSRWTIVRRMQYYAVPLVPVMPAICIGTLVRFVAIRSALTVR